MSEGTTQNDPIEPSAAEDDVDKPFVETRSFEERIRSIAVGGMDNDPLTGTLRTAAEELRLAIGAIESNEAETVHDELVAVLLRAVARVEAVHDELQRQRKARQSAAPSEGGPS